MNMVQKREKCTPYLVKAVNVGAELHVLVMAMGMWVNEGPPPWVLFHIHTINVDARAM